jgi:hypothetical protein
VQPVIQKLMAKLPADRFATATEAAQAIETTLARWRARAATP